jgi:cytochrome b6-f complex iron-sulfur subunit
VITRRTFVKGAAALPALPVIASGCGNDVAPAPIIDVLVRDDPGQPGTYGTIALPISTYPDLAPGGAVTLRIASLPPGERPFDVPSGGVLLIHRAAQDGSDEFVATRADCPHQGCPLGYSAGDDQIQCPCHGSRFRAYSVPSDPTNLCAGQVLHLPAPASLRVYRVIASGGIVTIDLKTDQSCGVTPLVVDGGKITIAVVDHPALGAVGGTLAARPVGFSDTLLIARIGPDAVTVVSAICTHDAGQVGLPPMGDRLRCPWHGSEYDYEGRVLRGPATRPLRRYPVTFDGATIVITVS